MHFILISIGSNIDRDKHTREGVKGLFGHFDAVKLSSVYESEAVGFNGKPFYNLVASATTPKDIANVCKTLKAIERENGRIAGEKKFAPRTLDLDLLTFDQQVTDSPVVLPRGEITVNAFVLQPLAELVPEHRHPVLGECYAELWAQYDKSKQRLWQVPFAWGLGSDDNI